MTVQANRRRSSRSAGGGYDVEVVPEVVAGETVYVASHPDLPRVYSQGQSIDEALDSLAEVRAEYLRDMQLANVDVPAPKAHPITTILEVAP